MRALCLVSVLCLCLGSLACGSESAGAGPDGAAPGDGGGPGDGGVQRDAAAAQDASTLDAQADPDASVIADAGPLPDVDTCFDLDGDGYGLGSLCLGSDCNDNDPDIYPGATEVCDGFDNDCDGDVDEGLAGCCSMIDNDFDGVDACTDCDDSNGSIYPGAPERCNGLDDDCDGDVDEDFDVDGDTYSVCAVDPLLFDCDDGNDQVNPGALEDCGPNGDGNGIDDNCNGFVDEGCAPCDPVDTDGDGFSECDGDCEPGDDEVSPGLPEICDGKNNDCNLFTVENCDVSDPCNLDGDGDPSNDPDQCMDDLLCACVVNANGMCLGDYICSSFCNTSATGPVGDGCGANMTCMYDLLRSANVHGCGVITEAPGALQGGEPCSTDTDCRSLSCDRLCVGPGCNQRYCIDYCGSDLYCAAPNTVCRLARLSDNLDGRCWPEGGPFLGSLAVGDSCGSDSDCDHGFCSDVTSACTEACCRDGDCAAGSTCSLAGDQIDTNYVFVPENPNTCGGDGDCATQVCFNGECAYVLTETAPMCVPDVASQDVRPAGAACGQNADCRSNFCDQSLGVCVEVCCSDTTCPVGLTCELQLVRVPDGAGGEHRITQSRICVSQPQDGIWAPM